MILVCYNEEYNQIQLWEEADGLVSKGENWVVWIDLEYAISQGWTVIGTL